jgi:hypothetical protein
MNYGDKMKRKINWFKKENIGNTFILIGTGLISGIIAVWINYFLSLLFHSPFIIIIIIIIIIIRAVLNLSNDVQICLS